MTYLKAHIYSRDCIFEDWHQEKKKNRSNFSLCLFFLNILFKNAAQVLSQILFIFFFVKVRNSLRKFYFLVARISGTKSFRTL